MSGFLDSTVEAEFTALGSPHSVQTLDFLKKVLKGIRYADLSVASRTVTGQVKYGDGTNVAAAVTVYIKSDQVITVNTGTLVTTGNSSIQVTTNASGVFQVTIAGTQGATVEVIPASGVSSTVLVGSGGTGGGGGGGISGITVKDEGSTVTGGPHTTFNFTGAGVTSADAGGGQVNVSIPGGAVLNARQLFTAAQDVAAVALTYGANIATDAALSNVFTVTLSGATAQLDNPTNLVNGQTIIWRVTQDGTGGRALTFGTAFDFGSAGVPSLATSAAGKMDIITGVSNGTKVFCAVQRGFTP